MCRNGLLQFNIFLTLLHRDSNPDITQGKITVVRTTWSIPRKRIMRERFNAQTRGSLQAGFCDNHKFIFSRSLSHRQPRTVSLRLELGTTCRFYFKNIKCLPRCNILLVVVVENPLRKQIRQHVFFILTQVFLELRQTPDVS